MKHLRLSVLDCDKHAETALHDLRITYQHSTPQTLFDQWWFWNCENIPEKLPKYLSYLELSPKDSIGWGLSKEEAEMIEVAA